MRSHLFVSIFAIALGIGSPIGCAIAFPEVAVAQSVAEQKKEAYRLLKEGIERFKKGILRNGISQLELAIQSLHKSIQIYQQIGDQEGKARSLQNLGVAYYIIATYHEDRQDSTHNYAEAIRFYEESLAIFHEIKNIDREDEVLQNLESTYATIPDYQKKIFYTKKRLIIA